MNWDIFLFVIALACVVLVGWSLIRLLNARQASEDRKYGGENDTERGVTG